MADFIETVANAFNASPITVAFFVGGVVISVTVGIVARIANLRGVWRGQAAARDRPQPAYTTKTPREVMETGQRGQRNLTCSTLLIFAFLAIVAVALVLWQFDLMDQTISLADQILGGGLTP